MKSYLIHLILAAVLMPSLPVKAGLAVVDYLQIARNTQAAEREMIELILQGEQQFEQIQQLLRQVQQMDDYLERLGDPKNTNYLRDLQRLLAFFESIGRGRTAFEIREGMEATELFRQRTGAVYPTIDELIIVDGEESGKIEAEEFIPEIAARRTLEHSREMQADTHWRREVVKQQLVKFLAQSQTAETASELHKINAAITGLRTELQIIDSEAEQAAREVQLNYHEQLVEERIARKVRLQREREKMRVGTEKSAEFFPMMDEPTLFGTLKNNRR